MSRSRELRRKARESLQHEIFGKAWLYALLVLLVVGAIESILGFTVIGTIIIMGPLGYGACKIFSRVARKETEEFKLETLFDGFKEDFARNIVTYLLMAIFEVLWTLLLIIPGIIKSYAYAMTGYILTDNPNIGANDAITKSRQMMRGHKWQLFCLDLSFIGWYIVGMLCLGIGLLWVAPYHEMARAHFYEELRTQVEVVK